VAFSHRKPATRPDPVRPAESPGGPYKGLAFNGMSLAGGNRGIGWNFPGSANHNRLFCKCAHKGRAFSGTHLHVVPRFPDDGLHLPSRSIPYDGDAEKEEILEKVRARLRERAEKRGGDAS